VGFVEDVREDGSGFEVASDAVERPPVVAAGVVQSPGEREEAAEECVRSVGEVGGKPKAGSDAEGEVAVGDEDVAGVWIAARLVEDVGRGWVGEFVERVEAERMEEGGHGSAE
jgi:hypothetical protein